MEDRVKICIIDQRQGRNLHCRLNYLLYRLSISQISNILPKLKKWHYQGGGDINLNQ